MANGMRVRGSDAVLTVIDVQEKLLPVITGGGEVAENCERLVRASALLSVPVLWCEQYPKGLGPTVEGVRQHLASKDGAEGVQYIEKKTFSCAGTEEFNAALEATGRRQVVLCGIEAHVCVVQTALDLIAAGYGVFVAGDAVGSRAPEHCRMALSRIERAGGTVLPVESVLFECMGASTHPAFRDVARLVK